MSSTTRKHKTSFKKKRSTDADYWGTWGDDGSEPQYTEEQKKRIASYLKENDENCKESTTLILIIVIGLLVALSIVGFLAIRNNSSIKYKGAHTVYEHSSNTSILDMVWGKWAWLENELFGINSNESDVSKLQAIVALEEELNDFQPIYRNPLLQELYKANSAINKDECFVATDDSIYSFITIKHGAWIPSQQYLSEAVDFSWADFQTQQETEEQELEETINTEDLTEKDKKHRDELKKQIEADRLKRKQEAIKNNNNKQQQQQQQQQQQEQKRRRLLDDEKAANPNFDPKHALPNPANIINPNSKGDEGAGDIEAKVSSNSDPHQFPRGILPEWLQNRRNPHDLAKTIRDRLSLQNKKHLKHLEDIRNTNRGKGVDMKSPRDILKQLDLSKFGIKKEIDETTTDEEKEEDLKKLEEESKQRHPYMTLLTNPGDINDIKCIKNNYRRHEVIFKVMDKSEAINTINNKYDDEKQNIFSYDNNVLMWYCYLIEIEQDTINDINGGSFKVNLTFFDMNMEVGFDYVEIYINSQLIDTVSGIGLNWEENEKQPSFIKYIDNKYVLQNGNALEICMKIVTDSNIIKDGFHSILSVDYDDPSITKWSEWSECSTLTPSSSKGNKNNKHWNGECGIGIRDKTVIQCIDGINNTSNTNILDVAKCNLGEQLIEYCVKANCYDFPMNIEPTHPQTAFVFNGHGRVDPDFADPFLIQRSVQESFNITNIIRELAMVRNEIISRYPDERILGSAVINHYYMDQSKLRLGIRLARSLLLGDTFTVYMTGSSNTAGHENMFMATWPMQFQSIMRPVWKRIGYKGAAFMVKNHAEGGALSSSQIGPCIPSLIGDDADIIYWESQMNDHGDAINHAVENHFRNSITLPRRPMFHAMHAGKRGPDHAGKYDEQYDSKNGKKGQFKNEGHCYGFICGKNKDSSNPDYPGGVLMEPYTDYGSGVTLFYPTNGIASVNKTKYEQFKIEYLYISWHPGPPGHRLYAEILAYHYLTSVLETFTDIKDLIDSLTPNDNNDNDINKPIEEMLEILQDPPTLKTIPHDNVATMCDPVCTNSTQTVCISGYKTLGKPRFRLKRWREKENESDLSDLGGWKYNEWMGNPQAFIYKKGGQGNNDIKQQWMTTVADSKPLKFIFEAKQYGFIDIEGDKIKDLVKDKKIEIKINEIDIKTGNINPNGATFKNAGQSLQCLDKETYNKQHNNINFWNIGINGCSIDGLKPYQKYQIVINVLSNGYVTIKNIRIY